MKRILTVTTALFLGAAAVLAQEKAEYKAYLVSNAHFDSQWNWDVQRSISEYIPKTMDRNLFLLEKYPDYIFLTLTMRHPTRVNLVQVLPTMA